MSNDDRTLKIYIIGAHEGESIVICTPGGRFGVIDAYAPTWDDPTANPTLGRLEKLGAQRLRFIALTHPHIDHFKGLPAIFDAYTGRIDSWWRPPLGGPDLKCFMDAVLHEIESEKTRYLRERLQRFGKIFRELFQRAQMERDNHKMRTQLLQNDIEDGKLFAEEDYDFSMYCLGPSTDIVDPYIQSIISKDFSSLLGEGPVTSRAPHNVISSVIALRYGKWIGILGGDTEKRSWNDILDRKREWLSLARFIKIPHHGSDTASYDELWETIDSDTCSAAVTCFASQRIPNRTGLNPLNQPRFSVHTTTKALAESLYHGTYENRGPLLRRAYKAGEVLVSVAATGEMRISHFEPAGSMAF